MKSPESFLNDVSKQQEHTQAIVLSISDNHVNILLRGIPERTTNSLFKMNVIPNHRDILPQPNFNNSVEELLEADIDQDSSKKIINFLSNLQYKLSSESGAEYSYYTVTDREKSWLTSLSNWMFQSDTGTKSLFKMEMISPASNRQIQRSMPAPAMSLIEETPELYETIVLPHIQSLIDSGSLAWIQNVVDGTKEAERLLLNTDDFILNIDTKWKTHPDPHTIPRNEWYKHKAVADLYCLAIVKDGNIRSLRDLRAEHIPMLQAILRQGRKTIDSVYGVDSSQIRVFIHYQPQFYHFHVHFTRLENEIGCQVERGHLLTDIIQNLQMNSEYYAKCTITYKLQTSSELFLLQQTSLRKIDN